MSLLLAGDGSLERLVESGFGFFVILMADAALLAFDFQLKHFFLQSFQQQRGAILFRQSLGA